MKKILSLVLALCMMLGLACAEDITGDWYATKMGDGETYFDAALVGMPMVLTLNEDGTAAMNSDGEVMEGTWETTETGISVTFEGEAVGATFADGELKLAEDGQEVIFSREAPAGIEFAEVKADAALEDFNGSYTGAYIKSGDSYLPAEMAASFGLVLPDLSIENGQITAANVDLEEAGIGTMLNVFSAMPMELKDGKLVGEFSEEGVEGSTGIEISLLQDGMLNVDLLSNGESMFVLYFTPAQ